MPIPADGSISLDIFLAYSLEKNRKIQDLDLVALTENIQTTHYETGRTIILYKGQVGTVVMEFDGTAFELN